MPVNRAAQEGQLAWFEPQSPRLCEPGKFWSSPHLCWHLATLSRPKLAGTGSLGQDLCPPCEEQYRAAEATRNLIGRRFGQ